MNRVLINNLKTVVILAILTAGVWPSATRASMVFSESFESPTAGPSGYSVGTGNLLVYGNPNYASPATAGTQFLVANPGNGPSGGSISWTFAVGVGTYTLTFDHLVYGFSTANQTLDVEVTSSSPGDLLNQTMIDNRIGIPSPILTFTQTFTTTGVGSVTLTLTDNTPSAAGNSSDLIVDNIQVNGPPAPEPTSIAILVSASGFLLRRRR